MKKIFTLILTLALGLSLAACGGEAEDQNIEDGALEVASDYDYLSDKGTLTIGYTVYEPMNYMDENGDLTGFDTEFAIAVAEKLGLEPEFVEISWDSKVIELDAKNIDCIWNGMTIKEELLETTAISDPYVENKQVIVVKKDSGITGTADLIGEVVAVEAGSAGVDAIVADEDLLQAEMVTVSKQTDALVEVKAGTSKAAVLDWTLAKTMVGEDTDFADLMVVEGVELSLEQYGIAFRKDSDVRDMVNAAMAELIEEGTLPALAEKYELNLVE